MRGVRVAGLRCDLLAAHRPVERPALVTPFDSLARVGAAHHPWLPVRWLATER